MKKHLWKKKIWLVFILLGICLSLAAVSFIATREVKSFLASIFLGNMEYLDDEDNSTAQLSFFVEVSVDFLNRDSLTEDDLIIFFDDDGHIFNCAESDSDSCIVPIIPKKADNCNFTSRSLDISVELPEINYDETWHITIDYKTATYQVEVEKAEVERLQNRFYLFFQRFQEMIEKAAPLQKFRQQLSLTLPALKCWTNMI